MPSSKLPQIAISPEASQALREALDGAASDEGIQLQIDSSFRTGMGVGAASAGSVCVEVDGLRFFLDPGSAERADGLSIDYLDTGAGGGFRIDNPNAPPAVVEIAPEELEERLRTGEFSEFFDVRTPGERELASLGARLLDEAAAAHIETLDRSTPLVFHCHHGIRSRSAAEHFRDKGFRKVYNMSGGIDAWSLRVDSSVPRY